MAAVFKALGEPIRLRLAALLALRGEMNVQELTWALEAPQFNVSKHLAVMRSAGLVEVRRRGTWIYYRFAGDEPLQTALRGVLCGVFSEHPVALADQTRLGERGMPEAQASTPSRPQSARSSILFVCTGNSCRSQMAEGWTRVLKGNLFEVYSAGVDPHGLNPFTAKVMAEVGVDISGHRSKTVQALQGTTFDWVVTLCDHAYRTRLKIPGARNMVHRRFDDPPAVAKHARTEREALDHYRRVRDEIKEFVAGLPESLDGLQRRPMRGRQRGEMEKN
jgi:arsenate reductase